MDRRSFLTGLAASGAFSAVSAKQARSAALDRPLRLVCMNSMNDTYALGGGLGSAECLKMAIDEFKGTVAGVPIELLLIDHQNKTDVAVSRTLQLFDQQGADAIFDIGNSAISLALQEIARVRGKILIHAGSSHDALYGKSCSPTGAMWTYDTYSLAKGTTEAVFAQGGKSWFFISADYAFGEQMQSRSIDELKKLGGKVAGYAKHPIGETDFSAYLLQATASGADIICLISAGADTVNAAKQASEFGVGRGRNKQRLTAPIFYLVSTHEVGAEALQGMLYLDAFYWDYDDASRALGKRYAARRDGAYPNHSQISNYSATLHYLRAVAATNSRDGLTVMRQMKATPVDDAFARGARLRSDGRLMHGYYVAEVKKPADVKMGWDLLNIRGEVSAEQVIRPLAEGACPYLDPPA